MRALVTGSAGFIGSHLVEMLASASNKVIGVDRHISVGSAVVREFVLDLRSLVPFHALHLSGDADVIFHLAAFVDVAESIRDPLLYMENNVRCTLAVLHAARDMGAKVVYISSSEVYGTAQYTPQDEKHPLQPQSPYAASKVACEALVEAYHRSYGVEAVILRPFNTYGPRQQEKAVIPSIIRQARDKDMVELGNVMPKRDFTYVTDTCRAMIAAAELPFGVYNVGSGQNISVAELAARITDKPVRVTDERLRPHDAEVWELRCDASKFRAATGWAPEVSLREGLAKTIAWHS